MKMLKVMKMVYYVDMMKNDENSVFVFSFFLSDFWAIQ